MAQLSGEQIWHRLQGFAERAIAEHRPVYTLTRETRNFITRVTDTKIFRESDEGRTNDTPVRKHEVERLWAELNGGPATTVLYFTRALFAAALPELVEAVGGTLRLRGLPGAWTEADDESLDGIRAGLEDLPSAERQTVLREVRQVVRSGRLRPAVLHHWGPACAACGCALEVDGKSECEVAHIQDVHLGGRDQLRNALPLCRSHHWAFDQMLWAIEPASRSIVVRKSYRNNVLLAPIVGVIVEAPTNSPFEFLGADVLEWRWKRFGETATGDL